MNKQIQNRAWSVLPKEFKEEVKKYFAHYRCALNTHEAIINHIFGLHNLTSDSENLSEPKPAEPKFTKGSMVHCTSFGYEGNYKVLEYAGGPRNCYDCIDKYGAYYRFYESDLEPYTEPKEVTKMKPIESKIRVYLATQEEDEEFRLLLHENGFKWNADSSLIDSSMWESDIESAKIHFIYPNKTVTYDGDKTSDTLTFSEFKEQYFGENVNNRQNIVDCDKQLDSILKDSFRNERRLNVATRIMSAILSNQKMLNNLAHGETTAEGVVKCIVGATMMYTDALIAECEKGGSDEN